jgi:hypothetical protein
MHVPHTVFTGMGRVVLGLSGPYVTVELLPKWIFPCCRSE